MKSKVFKFKVGKLRIAMKFYSPQRNCVAVRQLHPWSEKEMQSVVSEDDLLTDLKSLMPKVIDGSPEESMVPCLMNTLESHVREYGRLADADFCTYMTYYFLIRSEIEKALGLPAMDEAMKKETMLETLESLEGQGVPVVYTGFRNL
jgi:hypothetical protein